MVLKSSAGVGPLPYSYLPEPTRTLMLVERDGALKTAEQNRIERNLAESKLRAMKNQQEQAAIVAAEARKSAVADAIRKSSILAGMTPDEVKQSWGAPLKINSSGGSFGSREQWIYAGNYLYFRDGRLVSWQDK